MNNMQILLYGSLATGDDDILPGHIWVEREALEVQNMKYYCPSVLQAALHEQRALIESYHGLDGGTLKPQPNPNPSPQHQPQPPAPAPTPAPAPAPTPSPNLNPTPTPNPNPAQARSRRPRRLQSCARTATPSKTSWTRPPR